MKKIYRVYNVSVEIHALKKHYVSASEIEDMYMSSDNRPCLETENLDEAMNKFQSITVDTRRMRSAVPYYLCDAAAIQEFVIDDDEDEEFGDFYDFRCIPMVDEIYFDFLGGESRNGDWAVDYAIPDKYSMEMLDKVGIDGGDLYAERKAEDEDGEDERHESMADELREKVDALDVKVGKVVFF